MASLLVRLHDSQTLTGVVGSDDMEKAQVQLMSAITDLFSEDLSSEEENMVTDVLSDLLKQVETELRHMVATKLSKMENIPLNLILHMANSELDLAEPVLKFSKDLSDMDLVYIIKSQGPEYWQCIAARETLEDDVMNLLADTKHVGTAIALSDNDRVTLTSYALSSLANMAKTEDELAVSFIKRTDVPDIIISDLYSFVSKHVKQQIVETHRHALGEDMLKEIEDSIDEVSLNPEQSMSEASAEENQSDAELQIDFASTAVDQSSYNYDSVKPSYYLERASKHISDQGRNTVDLMVDVLKRGELGFFVSLFSEYTNLSYDRIVRFIQSDGMKRLAIASRAFDVTREQYSEIYAGICMVRDKKPVSTEALDEALIYFDKVNRTVARSVVLKSEFQKK
jgi:hypothetical protein